MEEFSYSVSHVFFVKKTKVSTGFYFGNFVY